MTMKKTETRQALAPLIPQPQLNANEIRTYSRKRKAPDNEESLPLTPTMEPTKKKKSQRQPSLSSFFKSPNQRTNQLPTPDSSPASSQQMPTKLTQLHLSNLGSATRTTIHCKTCQMQYNKIDPNDTRLHVQHHTSILQGPTFPRPHTIPRPSTRLPKGGDLIIISRVSPKELQKRGLQLLCTIDIALGAPRNIDRSHFFPCDGKIYAILSLQNRIISLVAAERISHAYKRIPSSSSIEISLTEEKAVIGINRMWTCISERGKGWCTTLLEECAAGFIYGADYRGNKDVVAFTTPSESGLALARKWTGREDFLVYEE